MLNLSLASLFLVQFRQILALPWLADGVHLPLEVVSPGPSVGKHWLRSQISSFFLDFLASFLRSPDVLRAVAGRSLATLAVLLLDDLHFLMHFLMLAIEMVAAAAFVVEADPPPILFRFRL